MKPIVTVKIHPAIGVARLGNSPTDFFIGPERPGVPARPTGGYRDAQGRIKRQAARFRLFGFDQDGNVVREITARNATITWTVHVANKKAEWIQFQGAQSLTDPNRRRNASVADRSSLIIDPGPRSLTGPEQHASFDGGRFLGVRVPLGGMRTDKQGRLLVLGGFGHSSSPHHVPINEGEFANNDGWHDDVSDGPVTASVTLKNGATLEAAPAWVICAPPKFAPGIGHPISLYDVLLQLAVDKLGFEVTDRPSFTNDIFPLLQRAIDMRWVSAMVAQGAAHGHDHDEHEPDEHDHEPGHDEHDDADEEGGPAHTTLGTALEGPISASARRAIFAKLRDPSLPLDQSSGDSDMPMIHSDAYPAETSQPLTRLQYAMLRRWKDGHFVKDWSGPPRPASAITPEGLDRAALEWCVGGPFYPGIEASWFLRDTYSYLEPFRLDPADLSAGDITKQMALPWQADFAVCAQEGELAWWPAQRPDDVFPAHGGPQVPWTRGVLSEASAMSDMVAGWHRLGFIVKRRSRHVETQREDGA